MSFNRRQLAQIAQDIATLDRLELDKLKATLEKHYPPEVMQAVSYAFKRRYEQIGNQRCTLK